MPYRILIADDHAVVRGMLKALVQTHLGWEVCAEAENGHEAIVKAQAHKPDLLIMDLAMPVKDGISASREISAVMPHLPIVMYTFHYSRELELEAKKAGVRKVVAKVASSDALLKAIEEALKELAPEASRSAAAAGNVLDVPAANSKEQAKTPAENEKNHRQEN